MKLFINWHSNEGMAYRFESTLNKPFQIADEQVTFNFPANHTAFISYVKSAAGYENIENQLINPFENVYTHCRLSEWDSHRLAFAPLLVESTKGRKLLIIEADLINYPGMYLTNFDGKQSLKGYFARYPDKVKQGEDFREELVETRMNYIASYEKGTQFPWRVIVVSQSDKELADNDIVYKLATPSNGDYSWVKPGKVAWDWWNACNLSGVNFKAGINNDTYKYYIDFASAYGLEYIIMDEGWSDLNNLYTINPEINLNTLITYATSKNVGILLWLPYYAFARDIEGVCKHYSAMGIKGFKIDFMDRDDQRMVDFHYRTAAIAAKHRLLIDYHGTYKPTGLHRTFPNVLNYEGVFGLENCKWMDPETFDLVTYDVTMPFIRMLAGPVDYTPGAMRNAARKNYRSIFNNPMSPGTRCHQLAQYIVYEAPLNMLADSPTAYEKEKECTGFIKGIPTVWDETQVLNGEVSQYISIARRKDNVWYVGALTNWDKREMELDFSFLGEGKYEVELFCDGINADRMATDYTRKIFALPANRKLNITLMPGGGCVMKIYEKYAVKTSDIRVRDPFILVDEATKHYYLHINGRNKVKVYKSKDLQVWKDCGYSFIPDTNFWGKQDFWAPDVYQYNGKYYLFITLSAPGIKRGTSILVADKPEGPFKPLVNRAVTPNDWMCLDGSLYVDNAGTPWILYCHEWLEVGDGEIVAQKLTKDLKSTVGKPIVLFKASAAPWVGDITSGEGIVGKVTDAPFIHKLDDGTLIMLWSSISKENKYAIGQAISKSGSVLGPWEHLDKPLNDDTGGHAMLFTNLNGQLMISYHAPNIGEEKPVIKAVTIKDYKVVFE